MTVGTAAGSRNRHRAGPHTGVARSPVSSDERDLVVRARRRERPAFEELVEACRLGLLLFCRDSFGLGDEDAEDAVQEACLRAWQRIESFRGEARFGTWLHAIATNVCLDLVRRNRRILLLEPSAAVLSTPCAASGALSSNEEEFESRVTARQATDLVNRVAARLREPDASICQLRFLAELTSDEMGRLLGMTAVNVRTRLCRRVRPALLEEFRRVQE